MTDRLRYSTRPYRPGDETGIVDGLCAAFAEDRTLEEWRWKFGRNEEPSIAVAVAPSGEVVGQYAVMPMAMQVDGAPVRAGQPADVFCIRRPGTVRQRVYLRCYEELISRFCGPGRRYAVLFGFPNARALRQGQLQMGYPDDPPVVPIYSKTVAGRVVSRLRREIRRGRSPSDHPPDVRSIEDLWHRSAHRYPVSVIRNGAWYEGRYRRRPGVRYSYATAERGGTLNAWAALRACGPTLKLVDLVWDGDDPDDLRELLRRCTHLARRGGQHTVSGWLRGDPDAEAMLVRLGWTVDRQSALWFAHRVYDPSHVSCPGFAERFYLTLGVSDHV